MRDQAHFRRALRPQWHDSFGHRRPCRRPGRCRPGPGTAAWTVEPRNQLRPRWRFRRAVWRLAADRHAEHPGGARLQGPGLRVHRCARRGLPIRMRATVGICCSPPLMRAPSRRHIRPRLENSASSRSGVRAGCRRQIAPGRAQARDLRQAARQLPSSAPVRLPSPARPSWPCPKPAMPQAGHAWWSARPYPTDDAPIRPLSPASPHCHRR